MNEPAAIELQLCGTARLRWDLLTVDLPDSAGGYLLACLGARGDWVLRDELVALFWPDVSAVNGQRSLRVNLNRLRDRLQGWGVSWALVSERRRIRWLPGSDVTRAREARARGDWPAVYDLLVGGTQAAAVSDFASGLSFRNFPVLAEWADGQRRALHNLTRDAVLRCADHATPEAAAAMLGRRFEADPTDVDVLRGCLQALASLGRHDDVARTFATYEQCVQRDLGVGADPALAELAARLGPVQARAATATRADTPAPQTPTFIARDQDLARAVHLLEGSRLLTLTGLGGVGKTRLAQALAANAQGAVDAASITTASPSDARGVLWLTLTDVNLVIEIAHRVSPALGLAAMASRDPVASAAQQLDAHVRLLVLDNLEHLLADREALHNLLSVWLQAAPRLSILATSREALGHPDEQVCALRALPWVDHTDAQAQPLAVPAVRLLVAQTQQLRPGFDPRPHQTALARIAELLGGLPLALVIAARWMRVLNPGDVLAALQRGVGALDDDDTAGDRTPPSGVRQALWRSWQLLDPGAQQVLARLSVRVSPFNADDALTSHAATLAALTRLIDHGLLHREELASSSADMAASSRLQLHPLVRAFALERLSSQPSVERQARQDHADHVLQQLRAWTHWRQIDQRQALSSIGVLLPEARQAWQWSLQQGHASFVVEAAPVLCNYFERLGRWSEGIRLYAESEAGFDADLPTGRAALAALSRCRALLLYRDGRFDAAELLAERALGWARQLGHAEGIKANLNTLALARWMLGRLDEALLAAREAHDLATADGDRAAQAVFAGTMALLHKRRGDYAAAHDIWQTALTVHREVGNWASACVTLSNLGNLLRVLGRLDEAVVVLDESLRLCDAYGFVASRPVALINLAQVHLLAGRAQVAETLAQQALVEARRSGERMLQAGTLLVLAEVALRTQQVGEAAQHLAPALRLARAIDDPANVLEALASYGRWCLALGRSDAAAQAFATVMAAPRLHAELREELQNSALARLPPMAAADLLMLVERASAELAA